MSRTGSSPVLGQRVDVQDWAVYPVLMPYWFDGNNLIGQSAAAAAADPRPRREFLAALAAYRRAGGGRLLVFFDGDDPGRSDLPPGVAVRYAAPESADAAIARRLREAARPGEITVVTNDLELGARCRRAGASTLDWAAFAAEYPRFRMRDDAELCCYDAARRTLAGEALDVAAVDAVRRDPAIGQIEHAGHQRDEQDAQPGQQVGKVERHRVSGGRCRSFPPILG